MKRQNSEQFHKLRNFWKITKDLKKDIDKNPNPYESQLSEERTAKRISVEPKIQQKWNSPMPIKPIVPLFQHCVISPPASTIQQRLSVDSKPSEPKISKLPQTYETPHPQPTQIESPTKLKAYRVKRTEKLRKRSANIFELHLLSNWGDNTTIGLSEIELFDNFSNKIPLQQSYLSVKNSSQSTPIEGLINGVKHSQDDKNLWVSCMPSPGQFARIVMKIPVDFSVCGMKIWNYAKLGLESTKCAKDVEVTLNNESVWKGELKRGDCSTQIILLVGFTFADMEIKIQKTLNSTERLVNAPPGNPKENFRGLRKYSKSEMKLKTISQVNSEAQLDLESLKDSKPLTIEDLVLDTIPELPKGRYMKMNLLSTWGDQNFIGLCGIEFWNEKGKHINISHPSLQITASLIGLHAIPDYTHDPKSVEKLVDGVYWTCDDAHVWLAPYHKGEKHFITFDFLRPTQFSMIRIWNFNKSRIHSYRGVKDMEILLDNQTIFRGKITKAQGMMKDAGQHCEYILFTRSGEILETITKNDWVDKFEEDKLESREVVRTRLIQNK